MSRIRTIRPDFWISEQVVSCSLAARLLFIGMWSFADDNGILPASAFRLKGQVFPHESCTQEDVKVWVNELISMELVIAYQVDRKDYWMITGWKTHQRIDKPTYRYPLPSSSFLKGKDNVNSTNVCKHSETSLRDVVETSQTIEEPSPTDWNGLERNCNGTKTCEVKTSLSSVKSINLDVSRHVSDDVYAIFLHWCHVMNHPKAKLDKGRQQKIVQALKLGYTIDELKQAIDGCKLTPFNMGQNDRQQRYDALNLILRDAEHIDRFMANAINPPTSPDTQQQTIDLMIGVL